MPKFNISIVMLRENNAPGANFNVQVDASDYISALEAGKSELEKVLADSGLTVVPAAIKPKKKS